MKLWWVGISIALLLVGCGQSQDPVAPETSIEESVAANDPIVDYIWNTASADLTEDQLTDIVARWNARIDAGGYPMLGANILRPQFETADFDLIWVVLWPSSEARDAAWADWNANEVESWRAEVGDALSYQDGNIFTFKPAGGRDSDVSETPEGGTFLPSFSFCNFNEGFDLASFDAFRAKYDAWLDEGAPSNYGYYIMEPQFEQNDADVVWLDLYSSEAAAQSGIDSWAGSELEADWETMVTCENYSFVATAIRR